MLEKESKRITHVTLVFYASVGDMMNDVRIPLEDGVDYETRPYVADKWISFDTIYESMAKETEGVVHKLT